MLKTNSSNSQLSLNPLGAGDLIDRAVRFYRKHFWVFILISSPTVIIGTICLVGWKFIASSIFNVNSNNPSESTLYTVFLSFGNFLIWMLQAIATLVVMGGASRNFVRHILSNEPITFRETYKNVKSRLGGLIAASTMLSLLMGFIGLIIFYLGLLIATLVIFLVIVVVALLPVIGPFLAFIIGVVLSIAAGYGIIWVYFLVVSRFVYVPQVMLVEGQGVFSAMGRSISLAGKNVNRVAALFIFSLLATYSALFLLYIPIAWYAWISGINIEALFNADTVPAWYTIANQVIVQLSFILLTPVSYTHLTLPTTPYV